LTEREKKREYDRHWRARYPEHYRAKNRRYNEKIKKETFKQYSPLLRCQRCGFADLRALSIDHIDGGGAAHRRVVSDGRRGFNFYLWLRQEGYPPGFQVLCMNCQFIKKAERGR
jgi:hypothetical protein